MTYNQLYAIKRANEERIKKLCPGIKDKSGIYVFYRTDELGINHSYVGQAKSVLQRCADHLQGYVQYIDKSLKAHKLFNEQNPFGWKLRIECYAPENQLDELERKYIVKYANASQIKNILSGGQGEGRAVIGEKIERKGYRKGIEQGKRQISKEIANLFEKHLNYSQKSDKPNKNQEKAIKKFEDFLNYYKKEDEINEK